jgi:hypothetical protein
MNAKHEIQHSAESISRRDLLVTSATAFFAAGTQSPGPAQAQQNLPAHAVAFSSKDLTQRTIERRAVEAAIWGMPIVSFDAMRQAC